MPQVCSIKKAKMSTPTELEEETVQPKSDAPDEITEEVMSPEYKEIARDMFEKITEYLNGELAGAKATGCFGHHWACHKWYVYVYHLCVFLAYSH